MWTADARASPPPLYQSIGQCRSRYPSRGWSRAATDPPAPPRRAGTNPIFLGDSNASESCWLELQVVASPRPHKRSHAHNPTVIATRPSPRAAPSVHPLDPLRHVHPLPGGPASASDTVVVGRQTLRASVRLGGPCTRVTRRQTSRSARTDTHSPWACPSCSGGPAPPCTWSQPRTREVDTIESSLRGDSAGHQASWRCLGASPPVLGTQGCLHSTRRQLAAATHSIRRVVAWRRLVAAWRTLSCCHS